MIGMLLTNPRPTIVRVYRRKRHWKRKTWESVRDLEVIRQ
jgi:hypothetical protein